MLKNDKSGFFSKHVKFAWFLIVFDRRITYCDIV